MKDLPVAQRTISEITRYLDKSLIAELTDLVERKDSLRVSGFPFCALKAAYLKMENIKETTTTAHKEWYTSIGTAAHLILQRWTASGGRIWGDWKCYNRKCKKIVRFSTKMPCPRCGSEMLYEEFDLKYRNISGHVDGVYEADDGTFWVIDYKTSSVKNIAAQRFNPTFPYSKNVSQITTYCALIEKKYNIKISGWALIYIARDDPRQYKVVGDTVTAKQKRLITVRCNMYSEQYAVLQNIKSFKDIRYLIETKPCVNRKIYDEHFKGFKGCPLEAVCFTDQITRVMRDSYNSYKETL